MDDQRDDKQLSEEEARFKGMTAVEKMRTRLKGALEKNEQTKLDTLIERLAEGTQANKLKVHFHNDSKKFFTRASVDFLERRKYIQMILELQDAFPARSVEVSGKKGSPLETVIVDAPKRPETMEDWQDQIKKDKDGKKPVTDNKES